MQPPDGWKSRDDGLTMFYYNFIKTKDDTIEKRITTFNKKKDKEITKLKEWVTNL